MTNTILANFLTPRDEREDGFTLIEILVVIIIIGILAAVAIPIFLNQQKTARDSATTSDVRNLATNVETALVANPEATIFTLTGGEKTSEQGTISVGTSAADMSTAITFSKTEGTVLDISGVNAAGEAAKPGTEAGLYIIEGYNEDGQEYASDTDARIYNSAEGGIQ